MESVFEYLTENYAEVISTLAFVAFVILGILQNPWAWPVGIIGIAFALPVYFEANLYYDLSLYIAYIFMSFYGWYQWVFGEKKREELPITRSPQQEMILLILLGIIGTIVLGYLASLYVPEASIPYWDAFTTSFSLIGQYLLARKRLENWLLWIGVDVFYIGIYFYKELFLYSGLNILYVGMAVVGYLEWRRSKKQVGTEVVM